MKEKIMIEKWREHTRMWFKSICTYQDFDMKICQSKIKDFFQNSKKIIYAEGPLDAGFIKRNSDRDTDNIEKSIRNYCGGPKYETFILDYSTEWEIKRKIMLKTGLNEIAYKNMFTDRYLFGFVLSLLLAMEYKTYSNYTTVRHVGIDGGMRLRLWDFFIKHGYISNKQINEQCKFVTKSGIFLILTTTNYKKRQTVCILKAPKYIKLNNNYDLHCDDGPAIQWSDGYSLYFLNGVIVAREVVETPAKDLDPNILLSKKNPLVRRELIKKIGIDRVIDRLGAKCLDRWNGYELLELQLPDMQKKPLYLKMRNPSNGQVHIECVSPNIQTTNDVVYFKSGKFYIEYGSPNIPTCKEALAWRDGEIKYVIPDIIT